MKRVKALNIFLYICVIGFMSCHAQDNSKTPKSPFEFRGIYSPTNALESTRDFYGTHHVDYDWGLWGHNLHKVLGENPDNNVLATIDGKKDKDQYCFSSDQMYDKLVEYIIDNFGDGESLVHQPVSALCRVTIRKHALVRNALQQVTPKQMQLQQLPI